ncbi:hypothetical protein TRFO_28692 [Tritrichomonas foetus]|uniref:Uncharacterized protein n=1 Tax=Tritrichomonas foetus TaxID=1144522 RepID=A0A1J4JXT1_9EUKA|nr:hypothetical protein TRFO_28692 [Tritrichomonas foetus]|eukprot:OHT03961.1 hypothetical protein TRFO_28692 [Tritrichomonas foetus]
MIPKPNTTNDDDDLSPIPRKDTNHPAPLQRYVRDRTQSFHPVGGSAADLAPEINPEGAQTRVTSVNITDDSHVEVYTQIKSPQSVKAMAKQLDFVLYGQATPNSNKLKSTSNETTTISKSIYNNTNNSNNNPNNQGISDIQKKAQNLEFVLFGRKPTSLNNPTNNSNISDNDGVPAEVKKVLASVKHRAARLDFLMFGVKPANGIDVGMLLDTNREAETEVDSVPVPLSIRFMKRTPRKVARRPPSIISGNDL